MRNLDIVDTRRAVHLVKAGVIGRWTGTATPASGASGRPRGCENSALSSPWLLIARAARRFVHTGTRRGATTDQRGVRALGQTVSGSTRDRQRGCPPPIPRRPAQHKDSDGCSRARAPHLIAPADPDRRTAPDHRVIRVLGVGPELNAASFAPHPG